MGVFSSVTTSSIESLTSFPWRHGLVMVSHTLCRSSGINANHYRYQTSIRSGSFSWGCPWSFLGNRCGLVYGSLLGRGFRTFIIDSIARHLEKHFPVVADTHKTEETSKDNDRGASPVLLSCRKAYSLRARRRTELASFGPRQCSSNVYPRWVITSTHLPTVKIQNTSVVELQPQNRPVGDNQKFSRFSSVHLRTALPTGLATISMHMSGDHPDPPNISKNFQKCHPSCT